MQNAENSIKPVSASNVRPPKANSLSATLSIASTYVSLSFALDRLNPPPHRDCFFGVVVQKFRGVLDPTLKTANGPPRGHLKATGNLLIGVSGGLGSNVLLDLVKTCYFTAPDPNMLKGGMRHPWKSGNVWQKVVLCYVDCSQAYEGVSTL